MTSEWWGLPPPYSPMLPNSAAGQSTMPPAGENVFHQCLFPTFRSVQLSDHGGGKQALLWARTVDPL